MVFDRLEGEDAPSRYTVIRQTAPKPSIVTETLRRWVEQAEMDAGKQPGVQTEAQEEIRQLEREHAELRRANEILKTASAFSERSLSVPRRDDRLY